MIKRKLQYLRKTFLNRTPDTELPSSVDVSDTDSQTTESTCQSFTNSESTTPESYSDDECSQEVTPVHIECIGSLVHYQMEHFDDVLQDFELPVSTKNANFASENSSEDKFYSRDEDSPKRSYILTYDDNEVILKTDYKRKIEIHIKNESKGSQNEFLVD